MKKLILAFIAFLIMGGGGAGAFFYFKSPAEAASVKDEVHDEHKEAKSGGHGGGDGHGGNAYTFVYVELEPLILPIIDEYGVNQTVSLVVSLEVENESDAAYIRRMAPRLNDALLTDMYGILNHHALVKDGVIQVKVLKKRMKHISDKVLGDDMVTDVLMQVLTQRPI